VDALPFTATPGSGLIAFGRIHPDKGTHTAIEIARRSGRPLTICGIVQDEQYFAERVAPHVDGERVTFRGAVGPRERAELLGAAVALLHPIDFAEPFGLSLVESMVCGTPVVGYRRGSLPEVVDEGVTGLLVDGVDEAVEAVRRVGRINRAGCRDRARPRFSADRMVEGYLSVYEHLLANRRRPAGVVIG
jgi:glycosyltransferase involved in cell wall biosynthesis